jgi:metal-responsive CopG/Arc/MetJ family transcriptional regulator
MQNVTLRIEADLVDELDQEADDRDRSRSEYIRQILRDRHEAENKRVEYDHLLARYNRLQDEHEQLQRNHDLLQAKHDRLQTDHDRLHGDVKDTQQQILEHVSQIDAKLPSKSDLAKQSLTDRIKSRFR